MSQSSPSRSGAFSSAVDPLVEQFAASISVDQELYREDIRGSVAHARMLAATGLISPAECGQIVDALARIESEIAEGRFAWEVRLEDIHMHIEQALIDRLGDTGRKLHTARSRNDQVATDLRLWVRESAARIDQWLLELQRAWVGRCRTDADVIVPAYTHLRRAQPVMAAHLWLAWVEKLERDRGRLADCLRRASESPLGAAAVAGTSLPVDREATARELGFDRIAANSIDATSDRDFLIEFAAALALIAIHLSNWAEEWILWSTAEFGFLELPHAYCTGSSIMPQKINPDALELIRGKSASVIGALQTLLVLVKGLPLAYNRDLQEDKRPVMEAAKTVGECLRVARGVVADARLQRDVVAARLETGFLDATALMEFLIRKGLPQRTAHHLVGELVREATGRGIPLRDLPLEAFRRHCSSVDDSVYDVLGAANAVRALNSYGSGGPQQVAMQVAAWEERLGTGS